jgi:hypothetical protein
MLLVAVAVASVGAGCGGGAISSDERIQMLMDKDRHQQEELLACQQKVAQLQASGAKPTPVPVPPEDPFAPVAIRFSPYTGVVDADRGPAHERLKIVLEPLDASGDVVKRAGSLDLEALESAGEGKPPKPYHVWAFPMPELIQTWLSGLGAYAYILRLPWPDGRPPAGNLLILRARFTTLGGAVLSAETEIPLPGAPRPPAAEEPTGKPAR